MASWKDMARYLGTGSQSGPLAATLENQYGGLGGALQAGVSAAEAHASEPLATTLEKMSADDEQWRRGNPRMAKARDIIDMMTMAAPATGMIRAYHGSNALFDAFDINKINSGIGGQVQGWGLYVAEDPRTAMRYGGNQYRVAVENPERMKTGLGKALEHEDLIDLNANVDTQSHKIQDALRGMYGEDRGWTGRDAYENLRRASQGVDARASQKLLNEGIPGMSYRDSSRVFQTDEKLVSIFETPHGWVAKMNAREAPGIGGAPPSMERLAGDRFEYNSLPFATEDDAIRWADSKQRGGTRNMVLFDDKYLHVDPVTRKPATPPRGGR